MISVVGTPTEFKPAGARHRLNHPGTSQDASESPENLGELQHFMENISLRTTMNLSTSELFLRNSAKRLWRLQACPKEEDVDEELYVWNKVVYWSAGGTLVKSFTMEAAVEQAEWCSFFSKSWKPRLPSSPPLSLDEPKIRGVCVLDLSTLHIFQESGEHFFNPLSFQVSQMWPTASYGLIVERKISNQEVSKYQDPTKYLPLIFSLLHPLDEMVPVGRQEGFFIRREERLVDVLEVERRCLLLMCNSDTRGLSLWDLHFASTHIPGPPLDSTSQRVPSFLSSFHSNTPTLSQMATLSRSFSPGFGSSMISHSGLNEVNPLSPDLSTDLSWEEHNPAMKEMVSKACFCLDLTGHHYLVCLYPKSTTLRFLKWENSEECSTRMALTAVNSSVVARDMACIPSQRLLVVLEPSLCLTLYTGPTRISRIHLPPHSSPLSAPILRRSSLRCPGFSPKFFHGEKFLSPVPREPPLMGGAGNDPISAIIAAHRRDIFLEMDSGIVLKVEIPPLYTCSTVGKCLVGLHSLLPAAVSLQLQLAWYCQRNAPGAPPCAELPEFLSCLMSQLGYIPRPSTPPPYPQGPEPKRPKTSVEPSDEDWKDLLTSEAYLQEEARATVKPQLDFSFHNPENPFVPHLTSVLYALHLLYEEIKLNTLEGGHLSTLCGILYRLARDLQLELYQDHYWVDCPSACNLRLESSSLPSDVVSNSPPHFSKSPFHVLQWFHSCLQGCEDLSPVPYVPQLNPLTRTFTLLFESLMGRQPTKLVYIGTTPEYLKTKEDVQLQMANGDSHIVIQNMIQLGITRRSLSTLPLGVSFFFINAILQARENPPTNWPPEAYRLLGREDLYLKPEVSMHSTKLEEDVPELLYSEVTKLLFRKDMRVVETFRLLQSSRPMEITVQQQLNVTDHEFIEEQEKQLYTLSIRTMALPVGRGMFTFRSCRPVITETLPIPPLCLSGKALPKNNTVELSHIEVPNNMNMWPLFHNGAAAGLRIDTSASQVDATWILYNKPRGNCAELPIEHAGFLLGLGLNNHLRKLSYVNLHDYLSKVHELTSIGVLLGYAASNRGTMDMGTTKVLSLHLEALLPTSGGTAELEVPAGVQAAALLGLGLVYQGSAHPHMAKVALGEVGRPPGPEMDHCLDREGYSLAAGLALGLIVLGKVDQMNELIRESITDNLHLYMIGGSKKGVMNGVCKEKYKSPSYQIREGDCINTDVTSPGATLALGLMHFNTSNRSVADWMLAPETQYLLDLVRPDFLLLRTLSRGLILWSSVSPDKSWVEQHIPEIVKTYAFKKGTVVSPSDTDFETMSQAYCNIIAGACLCLGLKFAGSANSMAYDTLEYYVHYFLTFMDKSGLEQAGRITVDTGLHVALLALSLVMAGTGDVEVMRLCRKLRSPLTQPNSYGFQMATHMALGFLFLGGGRYTLSTRPEAIAALVCSLFPKFPSHSVDNRYHLQAFRHLYALAVEPRLLVPRNLETGLVQPTMVEVTFKATEDYGEVSYSVEAPCLLPELHLLKEVRVVDSKFWTLHFSWDSNWDKLRGILQDGGEFYLKPRANIIPFFGNDMSLLAYSFQNKKKQEMIDKGSHNVPLPGLFQSVVAAADSSKLEFSLLLAECRAQEKMELFSTCLALLEMDPESSPSTLELWQVKLVLAWTPDPPPLHPQFVRSLQHTLEKASLRPLRGKWPQVQVGLQGDHKLAHPQLPAFKVLHDLPPRLQVASGAASLPLFYLRNRRNRLPLKSQMALLEVLQSS